MSRYPQMDQFQVKLYSIVERQNLVSIEDFAAPLKPGATFREFLEGLCQISHRTDSASDLRRVVSAIDRAKQEQRAIIWALGPHIIKYGLSRIIIQLMQAGLVTAIAMNGSGAIHDTEIALFGKTSEEMAGEIGRGRFGMWEETGAFIHAAARRASHDGLGFGESLGLSLVEANAKYADASLLASAYAHGIPLTLHVAIGTDIIHMHPQMNGAETGQASMTDFYILSHEVSHLTQGGVYLNIGSRVILPEIFLKTLTMANNLCPEPVKDFTTVTMDHESNYRPLMNVVRRPTEEFGHGFEIVGRMEILVPLLGQILLEGTE